MAILEVIFVNHNQGFLGVSKMNDGIDSLL